MIKKGFATTHTSCLGSKSIEQNVYEKAYNALRSRSCKLVGSNAVHRFPMQFMFLISLLKPQQESCPFAPLISSVLTAW